MKFFHLFSKNSGIVIDELIRTGRRSISLRVTPDARLVVRAPRNISKTDIEKIIKKKSAWIVEKQKRALERRVPHERFCDRKRHWYLGKSYGLEKSDSGALDLRFEPPSFYVAAERFDKAEALFIRWYREKAREIINERVNYFSRENSFAPKKVRISSARTRWGSCGKNGNLNFTWRLIRAPLAVIDYVVVHELCHLKRRDHSKKFWALVEEIIPGYRKHRNWLNTYGEEIMR